MAFTYDVTTNRGKIRLMVQDNDSNDYILEDADVDVALDRASSDLDLAAAECCRWIAAYFSQTAPKINIDGTSFVVDRTRTPGYWMDLAKDFETRANSKPYSTTEELTDDDRELQDAYVNKYEYRPHDSPTDSNDN